MEISEINDPNFGKDIREVRKKLKLEHKDFAKKVGVGATTVYTVERGDYTGEKIRKKLRDGALKLLEEEEPKTDKSHQSPKAKVSLDWVENVTNGLSDWSEHKHIFHVIDNRLYDLDRSFEYLHKVTDELKEGYKSLDADIHKTSDDIAYKASHYMQSIIKLSNDKLQEIEQANNEKNDEIQRLWYTIYGMGFMLMILLGIVAFVK